MGALEGLLVVAVEQAVAAPLCTARLAAAGARVIKIERAEGDFARGYDTAAGGESSYFTWLNQGKESVCLDFKDEHGARLLHALLARADVLVQNLSPGALARAGFSTDALQAVNPRLVVCNVSGYGEAEGIAGKRAYDLLVQAESGLIAVSGGPGAPGRIGVSVCDIGTGTTAHAAILEALLGRAISGRGEELFVSLFDVAADWMTVPFVHAEYGSGAPAPAGLRHPSIAPYGAFPCADGRQVLISIQNEREWRRLCVDVLRSPELATDTRYMSNNARVKGREALESGIAAITRTLAADEFRARLDGAGIACGSINGADDLAGHPAFRSAAYRTSAGVELSLPAHPVRRRDTRPAEARSRSGSYRPCCPTRCPTLGEHTASVTAEFLTGDTDSG